MMNTAVANEPERGLIGEAGNKPQHSVRATRMGPGPKAKTHQKSRFSTFQPPSK